MFEYRLYDDDSKVVLNPKSIVSIKSCGGRYCKVSLVSGDVFTLDETYEKVKEDFEKYMYSLNTFVSI